MGTLRNSHVIVGSSLIRGDVGRPHLICGRNYEPEFFGGRSRDR